MKNRKKWVEKIKEKRGHILRQEGGQSQQILL